MALTKAEKQKAWREREKHRKAERESAIEELKVGLLTMKRSRDALQAELELTRAERDTLRELIRGTLLEMKS